MNELRSHPNERNSENVKVWLRKSLKRTKKSLPIPTRYTFLFDGSIIGTPKLSVLNLEQFYVEWRLRNSHKKHVSEDKNHERTSLDPQDMLR